MSNQNLLDISWGTIFKLFVGVICLYIFYFVKDIVIWFIFALIVSILFDLPINFLTKKRIPRVLAVMFIYLSFFGILSYFIYYLSPLFISEIQNLPQTFPQYFEKISPALNSLGVGDFQNIEEFEKIFEKDFQGITSNIFVAFFAIFGGISSTIFVVTIAIFLSLEEKAVEKSLILFFPKKYEKYALSLWADCQKKVSGWFLSRMIACLFVGVACYFAFFLLNAKYPFSLGLLAGALNFIPIIGPIITAALIFLIVALDSFTQAVFVFIAFVLIQQIENNILTPLLSQRLFGLSPVLVLMSLAIGGTLWGILGAILVVPLAGIIVEFISIFLRKRKEEEAIEI